MPAASPSSSRCIRSRRPANVRPRRSTAILPISVWSRCCSAIRSMAVVLTTGCDKTTPAAIMAAATVNIPAIVLSGRADAQWLVERRARRLRHGGVVGAPGACRRPHRATAEFLDLVASSAPSIGHCNTMGTASTMNALAEALGLSLPGCAAIPAPYRERAQMAYETGRRAVEIVREDLKPSDILTREAFENAIVACSAIGGSTNAPIHINAIARHVGVALAIADWESIGYDVPLLVNMQPAGRYLGEEYYRAGGLPGGHARTDRGRPHPCRCAHDQRQDRWVRTSACAKTQDDDVIRPYTKPLEGSAPDSRCLSGNLFDSAIMKTSVISQEFRQRYLSNPNDPNAFEGRAVVFDGPEDYHRRIDDPSLADRRKHHAVHARRRANRLPGLGGGGEHAAARRADQARHHLAALHRRRPPVREPRPRLRSSTLRRRRQRAAGSRCCETGDRVRIDLKRGTANILISDAELAQRRGALERAGRLQISAQPDAMAGDPTRYGRPARRRHGARPAVKYQRVAQSSVPRDNH